MKRIENSLDVADEDVVVEVSTLIVVEAVITMVETITRTAVITTLGVVVIGRMAVTAVVLVALGNIIPPTTTITTTIRVEARIPTLRTIHTHRTNRTIIRTTLNPEDLHHHTITMVVDLITRTVEVLKEVVVALQEAAETTTVVSLVVVAIKTAVASTRVVTTIKAALVVTIREATVVMVRPTTMADTTTTLMLTPVMAVIAVATTQDRVRAMVDMVEELLEVTVTEEGAEEDHDTNSVIPCIIHTLFVRDLTRYSVHYLTFSPIYFASQCTLVQLHILLGLFARDTTISMS